MSRQCINHRNWFCYICGEFTPKSQLRNMTPLVKKSHEQYFGCMIGDQDKSWAPHFSCATCAMCLRNWFNGSRGGSRIFLGMVRGARKTSDCKGDLGGTPPEKNRSLDTQTLISNHS